VGEADGDELKVWAVPAPPPPAGVTVHVAEHTLTITHADGAQRTIRRTTNLPVRSWKVQRPRPPRRERPSTGSRVISRPSLGPRAGQ
jgi:hypothetical protein